MIFESLYGMCVTFFFVSPKALITLPSESNPLFICTDSAIHTRHFRTLLFCIFSWPYQMIQLAIQYDTTLISIHKKKLSLHYNSIKKIYATFYVDFTMIITRHQKCTNVLRNSFFPLKLFPNTYHLQGTWGRTQ